MTLAVNLTGLPSSDPVPGNYVEINWGVGPAAIGSNQREALLIGNKTSSGDATADTVIYGPASGLPLTSESDCIARFGRGSELHRMYRRFRAVNTSTPLYAIAVSEGSTPTAASQTITFATTATGTGTFRIWCGDDFCEVVCASGDTVTTIATAAAAAINAKLDWPITASSSVGVVTVTAKQGGVRGNLIRIRAQLVSGTPSTTVTRGTATALTSGAVADDYTTALATIAASRFYYIVSADCADASDASASAANFSALVSQVTSQALPVTGIRQSVWGGHVGTVTNATTLAALAAVNNVRVQVALMPTADVTPAEIAAHLAGAVAVLEDGDPNYNHAGLGRTNATAALWKLGAQSTQSAWLTRTQIKTCLNAGVTPIACDSRTQGSYVVKVITTKCLTSSVADYRVRNRQIVSTEDAYADDLVTKLALQFANKKLGDDPAPGQSSLDANTTSPRAIKACVDQLTRDYGDLGRLRKVESDTIPNTNVGRDGSNTGRCNIRVPLYVVPPLDQTATAIDDVSSAA